MVVFKYNVISFFDFETIQGPSLFTGCHSSESASSCFTPSSPSMVPPYGSVLQRLTSEASGISNSEATLPRGFALRAAETPTAPEPLADERRKLAAIAAPLSLRPMTGSPSRTSLLRHGGVGSATASWGTKDGGGGTEGGRGDKGTPLGTNGGTTRGGGGGGAVVCSLCGTHPRGRNVITAA